MNTRDPSLTGIPNIGKATAIGTVLGAISVAVPVACFLIYIGGGPMSVLAGTHVGFFAAWDTAGCSAPSSKQTDMSAGPKKGIDRDRNTSARSEPGRRAA